MNIFDEAEKRIEDEESRIAAERNRNREKRIEALSKFASELTAYIEQNELSVPVEANTESVTLGTESDGVLFKIEGSDEFRVKYLKDRAALTPDIGKFEAPKTIAEAAEAAVKWLQRKKNA